MCMWPTKSQFDFHIYSKYSKSTNLMIKKSISVPFHTNILTIFANFQVQSPEFFWLKLLNLIGIRIFVRTIIKMTLLRCNLLHRVGLHKSLKLVFGKAHMTLMWNQDLHIFLESTSFEILKMLLPLSNLTPALHQLITIPVGWIY